MAQRPAGRRTRIIRLLRIGLPLVAVGLLASVFLSGEPRVTDATLTFSEADLKAMHSGLQITSPQLSGASMAGDIYDFSASVVRPDSLDFSVADISELVGSIAYVDGPTVHITSQSAQLNLLTRNMILETGIELRTSDGYRASADRVEVDGDEAIIKALGNVSADGPLGHVEANRMEILSQGGVDNPDFGKDTVLRFDEQVRLTYNPTAQSENGETRP